MDQPAAPATNELTLRTHRAGDIGFIILRHGLLYHQEYNFGERFEAIVANICASFLENFDPTKEACWIAEHDSKFVGCVMLVKDAATSPSGPSEPDDQVAKLRLLLVEPSARGLGVGTALLNRCVEFASRVGYQRIVLWTQSVLLGARRLYQSAGFQVVATQEHESFGARLVGENWELVLPVRAEND